MVWALQSSPEQELQPPSRAGVGSQPQRAPARKRRRRAADFPTPAVGTQGDLKRDIYRGPRLASVDAAMIKKISARLLGETGKLQLRFEFCNVLNRVNLTNVNGSLTSPSFGRSTSTYDPRIIHLGARIAF